ncbi:MAG: transcription factor FapR [Firmicutes bacterium]|nr:transcription factor FapR [Bacillota bacterium]MDD4263476.1 transcription factor FapR [Bacillota bacterium]MDD4693523.1 transcription factor FapR [Bacillota bacterium]
MSRLPKKQRQSLLLEKIKEDPFLTDEVLATEFKVSIQTIRLDRLELGIPEVRQRTKNLAKKAYSQVKSLKSREIIGELLDLNLGKDGISMLEATEEMALSNTGIVRGHYIFAQANSLAVSLVDSKIALTGLANIKYHRPVNVGERLIAKAKVQEIKKNRYLIDVETKVEDEKVFTGEFHAFALSVNGQEVE